MGTYGGRAAVAVAPRKAENLSLQDRYMGIFPMHTTRH
ncbi:hypothetical protein BofuT4_P145120.1 [Botrytis cinerea T4]|uniref:Uncharacterized protein n=1 Tax=Botryotinia fuckeliana (strain T4) TaxID=999810 RepID=G2YYK6_BOTF4|nr:hypothetical protein BofuT4_P145120.1 [Botrytis cinerea T4]